MISNKLLAKIAVFGGFITISCGFYVNRNIQARIRAEDYYKDAMKYLRSHRGAITLLGEPIKAGNMDLGNTEVNFCDGYRAQFEVPVKGPISKGTVYFWARRDDLKRWEVYRLELGLSADKDRRLVVRRESNSDEQ